MHELAIAVGNFFFRYRNKIFPIVVVALYALAVPPRTIFGSVGLEHAKDGLALVISLSGLALRGLVIGFAYIKRGGRGRRVYAKDLVTDGLFGVSRNPLYLGNLLICVGMFLMHGDPVVMALGIGFYLIVYQCIVLAEEAYLTQNFGEAYLRYTADVPRWLPKLSRFPETTAGMQFQPRRIVEKDYSTIALTLAALAATEAYQYLAAPDFRAHLGYLALLVALLVLLGAGAKLVNFVKKRHVRPPAAPPLRPGEAPTRESGR